jgi:hypothetical protein
MYFVVYVCVFQKNGSFLLVAFSREKGSHGRTAGLLACLLFFFLSFWYLPTLKGAPCVEVKLTAALFFF